MSQHILEVNEHVKTGLRLSPTPFSIFYSPQFIFHFNSVNKC